MAKTAEVVTVADLRPNADNPRSITDDKLKALKAALEEFGDLGAVVFNRKSGQLVGGHQRAKLFSKNSEIRITKRFDAPTRTGTVAEGYVILKGERFKYREVSWSLVKEKAANIAANKGAGEWDLPKLATWMQDLKESGFDLNLTMFDESERASMLTVDKEEPGCDEDDAPEPPKKPKSRLGDIYVLGNHRLMCGDSTDAKTVERLLNGAKADMVFTDPPYGMNLNTSYADSLGPGKGFDRSIKNYKAVLGDNAEFDFKKSYALVKNIKEQFWWGADYYCDQILKGGSWVVWDKKTNENLQKMFGADFELCWSKQKRAREIARVTWAGVLGHNKKDDGDSKVHPTMKAVKLIEWFFERVPGKVVIDLFGGSGSTLIACEKTDRRCYMMELDPKYCDVIVTRWEKYSGKKAKLVNNEIKKQKRGK